MRQRLSSFWRVFKQVLWDYAPPGSIALAYTVFSHLYEKQLTKFGLFEKFLTVLFVLAGYYAGWLRARKKIQDDDRHGSSASAQETVLQSLVKVQADLADSARKIEGYTTGGASFAYVTGHLVTNEKLLSIFIKTQGEFPVYELVLNVFDLDAPFPEPITHPNQILLNGHLYRFDFPTLTAAGGLVHHQIDLPLPLREKVRLRFTWQARNATWQQLFTCIKVDGLFLPATVVYFNGVQVYEGMVDGFPHSERPTEYPGFGATTDETVTRTI